MTSEAETVTGDHADAGEQRVRIALRSATGSDALLGLDSSGLDGGQQGRMVPLVLVRVRRGERRHRMVERVVGPEVSRDHWWVARPGMTACEGPRAEFAPCRELVDRHRIDDRAPLLVLELPDVHVLTPFADRPPEEDVARGL